MEKINTNSTYLVWERQGWGNKISPLRFTDETLTVSGCVQDRPKVGDFLEICAKENTYIENKGGDVKVKYEFFEVDYLKDPPDMFFGKLKEVSRELFN